MMMKMRERLATNGIAERLSNRSVDDEDEDFDADEDDGDDDEEDEEDDHEVDEGLKSRGEGAGWLSEAHSGESPVVIIMRNMN